MSPEEVFSSAPASFSRLWKQEIIIHPLLTTEKLGVLAIYLIAVANIYRSNVGTRVDFAYISRGNSHRDGMGAGGIRSHCIHNQETGRGECGFSSPFLLHSQPKSSVCGMLLTTGRIGPPTSINLIYIISDSYARRIVSIVFMNSIKLIILTLTWGSMIQRSSVLAARESMVDVVSLPVFFI